MNKILIVGIGLIVGFIFEIINLTGFYKIFFPPGYVDANASLFLLVYPLILMVIMIGLTIFIKRYDFMWLAIGLLIGFLICILGFLGLLGLGYSRY